MSRLPAGTLIVPSPDFGLCFDQSSFSFEHALSGNPLFATKRLADLARQLQHKNNISYHSGDGDVHGGWGGLSRKPRPVASVFQAIERIQSSGAWIKISHAQELPEYAKLLDSLIEELSSLCRRPLRHEITRMSATIFISSAGAVTPYHMDHETNFLFQIRGRKSYNLFDARDAEVVPPAEIERFLASGGFLYRSEKQVRAKVYELEPGRGIHQPSCWPHWAKTGYEPSVSLSFNFCLRDRDETARVHQYNYYLRRLGLSPLPPGRSRVRDRLKQLAWASFPRNRPAKSIDDHLRGHLRRIEAPLDVIRWVKRHVARSHGAYSQ